MKFLSQIIVAVSLILVTGGAAKSDNVLVVDPAPDNVLRLPAAAGVGNRVSIDIAGDRNGGANLAAGAGLPTAGEITQDGTGNDLAIQIVGDDNSFAVNQGGADNIGRINIEGGFNQAFLTQFGVGNLATISQVGSGNFVVIRQTSR